ncbi:MAG TPA: K(+)-transporting ATPase subunit F [Rhodanobacter sp.]|nr:K(+)-transporting ATPase subunit F [Rhodanobacter sp.]
MHFAYVIAAIIAVLLIAYLCVALLKPEWFE